jgi:hypothetical protein
VTGSGNSFSFAMALLSLVLRAPPASAQQSSARLDSVSRGGASLSIAQVEAALGHARVLAHDSLAGRSNGSRGQRIALEYIAAQFARLGLETLPSLRGHEQSFGLRAVIVDPTATRLIVSRGRLADTVRATAHGWSENWRATIQSTLDNGVIGLFGRSSRSAKRPRFNPSEVQAPMLGGRELRRCRLHRHRRSCRRDGPDTPSRNLAVSDGVG